MQECMKKAVAFAMVGTIALTSVGCGGKEEKSAKKDEEINIRVASVYVEGHSMNKVFTDVLDEFKEEHPNVTITEEFMPAEQLTPKLKTDAASDNMPDIFPAWVKAENKDEVEAGLWLDMGEALEEDAEWKDGLNMAYLEQFQYDGIEGTWAVPLCSYAAGFFYNKEVFEKAGVEIPETWDELLITIEKLKAAGFTPWSIGAKDTWRGEQLFSYIYFRLNGIAQAEKLGDRSIAYNDPSFVKTFEKIEELVDAGAFDPNAIGLDYSQEVAAFAAGKAGMQLNGSWAIGETDSADTPDTIKGKIGFFGFPRFEGSEAFANNWTGGPNDAFAVSAKVEGEKKELVIELIKKLASADTAKRIAEETGNLPAVETEYDHEKSGALMAEVMEAMKQADKFCAGVITVEPDSAVIEKIYNYTQAVIGKMMTPEEACKELQAAVK